MPDAFDGRAIANFILDYCEARRMSVTNLALQKLVYFCHVWSLIELHKPLVRHKFEAWEYGPVLPYLYREFKGFDRSPIKGRAKQIDPYDGLSKVVEIPLDGGTKALLERTLSFYTRLSAADLVRLSHAEGGPWHNVWNHKGRINPGMRIDDDDILRFYSKSHSPFPLQ